VREMNLATSVTRRKDNDNCCKHSFYFFRAKFEFEYKSASKDGQCVGLLLVR
jgi:hypothetical protein